MDIFYGFLIGVLYPVFAVLVMAAIFSGRTGATFRTVSAVLLASAGPVFWAIVFATLGTAAGIAAFGGWILGVALSVPLTFYFILSQLRRPRFSRTNTTRTYMR